MGNRIELNKIFVQNNTVQYTYHVEGDWKKYFYPEKKLKISYSVDISAASESVLAIPFLCNILPIAWLCDAEICIDVIDKYFYEHIEQIKDGYRTMYPMFSFKGKIQAETEKNAPLVKEKKSACFFSGGVDAYTTLFRHMEEQPVLITIWGADIKLTDEKG